MRLAIISQAMDLADDAPVEDFRQVEHGLDFVGHHPADRNAGPVGHDRGDRLLVDMRVDHPLFRIDRASSVVELVRAAVAARLGLGRVSPLGASAGVWRRRASSAPSAVLAEDVSQAADLLDQRLLARPIGFQGGELFASASRFPRRSRRCDRSFGDAEIAIADQSAAFSASRAAIATRASSIAAGVAVWLIATRAQAVSSRLTALSGNCRAGM